MDKYFNFLMMVAMTAAVAVLTALAALFCAMVLSDLSRAHSFYEWECCSERDCEPLPPDQVKITPQGYVLPNGQTVAFGQERVSPDRDYHWCRYPGTIPLVAPADKKVCFYAPTGAM